MATSVEFHVTNARELIDALNEGAAKVSPLLRKAVDGTAVELRTATQRNASGRPGPNPGPTEEYIASWHSGPFDDRQRATQAGEDIVAASVYSDEPQAHRLEFGFVGTDSAGRHVNAPPYAHLGPAIDTVKPLFDAAMDAVQEQAVDW